MKKILFSLLAASLSVGAQAGVHTEYADTSSVVRTLRSNDALRPITPTYMKGTLVSSSWADNWFVQVAGGATAFLGKPLGCDDIFGRMKPAVSMAIG